MNSVANAAKRPELFETVLVSGEFALGVFSISLSQLSREDAAATATAEDLIRSLGLTSYAPLPGDALPNALTALVVNESVDDVVSWLAEPPDPVELERLEYRRESAGLEQYVLKDEIEPIQPARSPSCCSTRLATSGRRSSASTTGFTSCSRTRFSTTGSSSPRSTSTRG
jgi:hypothetical protein